MVPVCLQIKNHHGGSRKNLKFFLKVGPVLQPWYEPALISALAWFSQLGSRAAPPLMHCPPTGGLLLHLQDQYGNEHLAATAEDSGDAHYTYHSTKEFQKYGELTGHNRKELIMWWVGAWRL